MNTKKITVGFSTSKIWNPFSALIKFWWGTEYSHVYLRYDSVGGNKEVLEASGFSVKVKDIQQWQVLNRTVREYTFEVSDSEYLKVMQSLRPLLGKPYGWKQILGIIVAEAFGLDRNPLADGSRSFICSELAYRFLLVIGIVPTVHNVDKLSPYDIEQFINGVF